MVDEPDASGKVSENINSLGRAFTAPSVSVCLPAALAQKGPHALGIHVFLGRELSGVPRRRSVTTTTPSRGIERHLHNEDPDLARRLGDWPLSLAIPRLIQPSVSHGVIHCQTRPVLVVPGLPGLGGGEPAGVRP